MQEPREPQLAAERRAEAKEKANKKKHKTTDSEARSGGGFNNSSGMSTEDLLPTELQGDMVFENGCLFLRDALLFADSIKSGDSGLVILVLKHWVFNYRETAARNTHMKCCTCFTT